MQNKSLYRPPRTNFSSQFFFAGACDASDDRLPAVPILRATRERLEQLLQEAALDLSAISKVILDDVGATLQILRLIGEEYLLEDDRPVRMEHCIASLDADAWFPAVCSAMLAEDTSKLAAWEHARRIAHCAEQLAAREETLHPGDAQLVGLLHEVGRLPELLGWRSAVDGMEGATMGVLLAEHWHLPSCVLDAVREQGYAGKGSQWVKLLDSAHTRNQQQIEMRQPAAQAKAVPSIRLPVHTARQMSHRLQGDPVTGS